MAKLHRGKATTKRETATIGEVARAVADRHTRYFGAGLSGMPCGFPDLKPASHRAP